MDTEGNKRGRAGTDTADGYRGKQATSQLDAGTPTEAADVEELRAGLHDDLPSHDDLPDAGADAGADFGAGAAGVATVAGKSADEPAGASPRPPRPPRRPGGADGYVLADRYRLGQRIGQGGMASVYQARDEALGREVAIKLFHSDATDADEINRQQGEVRVLASLNHPNLVIVFDAGTDTSTLEPRTYLVMELVRGTDLHRLRRRSELGEESKLSQEEVATMGAGLADALAYIHGEGIVHRDVKPANILLGGGDSRHRIGHPKLTDFGIARLVDSARLTATGQSMGTATYFSPEQAQGLAITPACDVYSLGLVLLECLTGRVAFPGPAVASAAARVHRDPEIPASLGRGWVELLTAMTARNPADRPSSDEVAAALRSGPAAGALGGWRAGNQGTSTEAMQSAAATGLYPSSEPAGPDTHPVNYGPTTSPLPVTPAAGMEQVDSAASSSARSGRQLDLPEEREDQEPSNRRRRKGGGLSALQWVLLVFVVAVVAAAAVVVTMLLLGPTGVEPVDYPSVPGELGQHLEDLQESVAP
ncbi:serine/threonine-protein kinase [Arthrobacter monumenti]